MFREARNHFSKPIETVDIKHVVERLPEDLAKIAFPEVIALQLSQGCSGACGRVGFCGFSANPGVGGQFERRSVVKFFQDYGERMPEFSMAYFASDMLDYYQYPKLLREISPLFSNPARIFNSTALPVGQEDKLRETIKVAKKYNQMVRLSFNPRNDSRIERFLRDSYGRNWAKKIPKNLDLCGTEDDARLRVGLAKDKPLLEHERVTASMLVQYTKGIGCQDGIVISPVGIEATVVVAATSLHPEGLIKWPILPDTKILPKAKSLYYLPEQKYAYEKLPFLNEGIPDIELIDFSGRPVEVPTTWVAERDLLYLAHFARQVADFGWTASVSFSTIDKIYSAYQSRMRRAKIGAEASNNQELKDLATFISRAVDDLWPQLMGGKLVLPYDIEEKYKRYIWGDKEEDGKSLLNLYEPAHGSTDLTKYSA